MGAPFADLCFLSPMHCSGWYSCRFAIEAAQRADFRLPLCAQVLPGIQHRRPSERLPQLQVSSTGKGEVLSRTTFSPPK